jgi:hypothetical protein
MVVVEGSETGRCRRGRPRLRGGGGLRLVSSGEGLCVAIGDEDVGLPLLEGVGKGEGFEAKPLGISGAV